MKTCGRCNKSKDLSFFSKRGTGHQAWCKECNKEHKREWLKTNRSKVKVNTLWSKYRLRPEDYQALWDRQKGKCALCSTSTPTEIDHDHKCCSGKTSCGKCVRAILCKRCNILVGFLEKDIGITRKALRYCQL